MLHRLQQALGISASKNSDTSQVDAQLGMIVQTCRPRNDTGSTENVIKTFVLASMVCLCFNVNEANLYARETIKKKVLHRLQ